MSVNAPDRHADIYLNFIDNQSWLSDLFLGMTFAEFRAFGDYCFKELDFAAEAKDGAEFRRVKGLLIAVARKEMEVAHFMDGLTDAQRASTIRTATALYELAKSFYPASKVPAVEAAWAAGLDHAKDFGWSSVAFKILAPRPPLFRDG